MRLAAAERTIRPARILLMDDEEMVREVVSLMLMRIGCEVDVACDGAEAVAAYAAAIEARTPYDAVITDRNVAFGMDGDKAAQRLKEIDPEAKVIMATGDYVDDDDIGGEQSAFCAVVSKPLSLDALSATLRSIGVLLPE